MVAISDVSYKTLFIQYILCCLLCLNMSWSLPALPGYSFNDPTKSRFHIPRKFDFQNGIAVVRDDNRAIGGELADTERIKHLNIEDSYIYDPSLTYGRIKKELDPIPQPHWVVYDKCNLIFKGYIKTFKSNSIQDRRNITLIYFLEDDTLTIVEPYIKNSGLWQGKIVKRNKISKNESGEYWHWKDLNIGKDFNIFGHVYHLSSCDDFTKDFMESQGILLGTEEEEFHEYNENIVSFPTSYQNKPKYTMKDLSFRKFLKNDGKILKYLPKFTAVQMDEEIGWDFNKQYQICFYLSDDTLSITESNAKENSEITIFPTLLKRTKVPKDWKSITADTPVTHEIEMHDRNSDEFYTASDLFLGKDIDILGRKFLLCDCDSFTRNYYKVYLNVDQESPLPIKSHQDDKFTQSQQVSPPPHIGIGDPDDTLMSCFTFHAKPPFKDLVQYNLNTNKRLRYLCEMISVHPEDSNRNFVMSYNLSDGTIRIDELPIRNSGLQGGRFSGPSHHLIPGSNEYYNPNMFYIGSVIKINGHRFKIKETELYVYKYMTDNPAKFSVSIIDNIRHHQLLKGTLNENQDKNNQQRIVENRMENMILNEPHIHTSQRRESHNLPIPLSGLSCARTLPELPEDSNINTRDPIKCLTGVALPIKENSPTLIRNEDEESDNGKDEPNSAAGKPTKMVTFADPLTIKKSK